MSLKNYETITCTKCHKESGFPVWSSINTKLNPEMKDAVRTGSAFRFVCPNCGKSRDVDYGFLYHQMEDHLMVHYVSRFENFDDIYKTYTIAKDNHMMMKLKEFNYTVRIVRTKESFREKLTIFDAGLDDRIIELQKLAVISGSDIDFSSVGSINCLLTFQKEQLVFKVFADGLTVRIYDFDLHVYNNLNSSLIGQRVHDLFEDALVVDHRWACDFFRTP